MKHTTRTKYIVYGQSVQSMKCVAQSVLMSMMDFLEIKEPQIMKIHVIIILSYIF